MKSNFPKLPFFFSIILFLFSCSVFFFFYRAINDNNQESRLKEEKWQIEASRREDIKALDRSVKTIEGERAQFETHFARSSDIVPFLDTIEGLAPKVGIEAEITSPLDILEDRTGLIVGIKASGTFGGIYKFLTLLENSPYELEFIGVDIKREIKTDADKSVAIPKWNAVFKIKLLSFVK